jgi:hypothetical protein
VDVDLGLRLSPGIARRTMGTRQRARRPWLHSPRAGGANERKPRTCRGLKADWLQPGSQKVVTAIHPQQQICGTSHTFRRFERCLIVCAFEPSVQRFVAVPSLNSIRFGAVPCNAVTGLAPTPATPSISMKRLPAALMVVQTSHKRHS